LCPTFDFLFSKFAAPGTVIGWKSVNGVGRILVAVVSCKILYRQRQKEWDRKRKRERRGRKERNFSDMTLKFFDDQSETTNKKPLNIP
jgi:hypothetical protein